MLSLTKVNTLLCIALFFNPYALAEPVSSAVNGIQGEGQKDIIVPSKESLKNETTVSSSQNEITIPSQSISAIKELKLTQIIIDIEKSGDYFFGIYPNDNKNKNIVDNPETLRPHGTVSIYDITNNKNILEIDLDSGKKMHGDRVIKTDGVFFSFPIKVKSQYLIKPVLFVESDNEIDNTFTFLIQRKKFVK